MQHPGLLERRKHIHCYLSQTVKLGVWAKDSIQFITALLQKLLHHKLHCHVIISCGLIHLVSPKCTGYPTEQSFNLLIIKNWYWSCPAFSYILHLHRLLHQRAALHSNTHTTVSVPWWGYMQGIASNMWSRERTMLAFLRKELTSVKKDNAFTPLFSLRMALKARIRATPASCVPSTSVSLFTSNTRPILEKKIHTTNTGSPCKPHTCSRKMYHSGWKG